MYKAMQALISFKCGLKLFPSSIREIYYCSQKMSQSKLQPAKRLDAFPATVWVEFGDLIEEHQAIPLSRGSPDFPPSPYLTNSLAEAVKSNNILLNQYTRSYGHLRLVNILSKLYGKVTGRDIDPINEVLVTIGAYESLFCSIMGNINPGDEVIIIEPYYDCYVPMVKFAGGIPICVPLIQTDEKFKEGEHFTSANWILDFDDLENKFNSRTKAIILNTPHNPTGKVFSYDELNRIAQLAQKHDVLVISDEVYEWLVYDNKQFTKICTLPGMWERTITIGSAGKMFSCTGWKVGWSYGHPKLIANLQAIHQNSIYTCPTPVQEAIAGALELELDALGNENSYCRQLRESLERKRNRMVEFCKEVGLKPVVPAGSYFMIVDYTDFSKNFDCDDGSNASEDFKVCRWLIKERGLAVLPVTCFYSSEHKHIGEKYFRIAFVKQLDTMNAAEYILKRLAS